MKEEFISIDYNQVSDIVDLPLGKKPIDYKWVYKTKLNFDGTIE